MNFSRLYNKVFCVVQWSIGFSKGDIKQIIREKRPALSFKWLPLGNDGVSIADPFIFKDSKENLILLYEAFSVVDTSNYGKIVLATLDKEFNVTFRKQLLDAGSHSSYPIAFKEDQKTYIIPETSQQQKVSVYEYDFENKSLTNEKVILAGEALLDSTIVKYNGKYWLFATLSENEYDYSKLHIFYSDSLLGKYQAHAKNPVKDNKDGSRPAGNFITVDGELYRPAQNCSKHYGESIAINKITLLSETEFSEEFYFKLKPDESSRYRDGVHTINVIDDIIVIDGIKMIFDPVTKWKLFLNKKLRSRKKTAA